MNHTAAFLGRHRSTHWMSSNRPASGDSEAMERVERVISASDCSTVSWQYEIQEAAGSCRRFRGVKVQNEELKMFGWFWCFSFFLNKHFRHFQTIISTTHYCRYIIWILILIGKTRFAKIHRLPWGRHWAISQAIYVHQAQAWMPGHSDGLGAQRVG